MPNWCYHKLRLEGDPARIADFRNRYCLANGALQLERVVPMPTELDVDDGSDLFHADLALHGDWDQLLALPWFRAAPPAAKTSRAALIAWMEREYPNVLKLGRQAMSNRERFGFPTWWGWRNKHWGTKWEIDARSGRIEEPGPGIVEFHFDTAWSPILPVLEAMTRAYPALCFRMAYADEGGGFAGTATAASGVVADLDRSDQWEEVMRAELGLVLSEDSA